MFLQKTNELQKRQLKKENKVISKQSICNQTTLWKNSRKYQALDYFTIPTCFGIFIFFYLIVYNLN